MGRRRTRDTIPWTAQLALQARLEQHVPKHWKECCRELVVRFRGRYAYVDAFPAKYDHLPGTTPEERARIEATPVQLQ